MRVRTSSIILFSAAVFGALPIGISSAQAHYALTVTTSGTLTSLSDPNDLLGAGTALTSGSYTLSIYYSDVGGDAVTTNPAVYTAFDDPAVTGIVTVTVNGHSLTTSFAGAGNVNLLEQTDQITNVVTATDAAGDQLLGFQSITASNSFIAVPDFLQALNYLLTGSDTGSDTFAFLAADNRGAINLSGVPTGVSVQVPEPESVALLGCGLIGLGLVGHRRMGVQ